MASAPFHTTRARDAWSTIRGFVYQVALSVERWLSLTDDDVLELEAGEDIDLCIGALRFDYADQERALEQIKHREGSITLRTDEARAFLANAYEHQNNNPGRRLVSRLISTAPAGQETPTPLSPRAPAIDRWVEINAKADPVADKVAIEAIISLLREGKQPRTFNEHTWNIFASFVRNAEALNFARFMADVEWSLGSDGHEDVESRIRTRLVSEGWCTSSETAVSGYQHLFFHIFHLLAKRETKSLTRADLRSTLDQQQPTDADVKIWKRVSDLVAQHDVRITILETEAVAMRTAIETIVARTQNVATELVIVNQRRNFSPPPPVADHVDRAAQNKLLVEKLKASRIIHTVGESGIGKTQLVRAATQSKSASWVRLRHRTGHEVIDAIRAGREHALANGHELLILDDVGRISDSDPVAESIAELKSEPFVTVSTSLFEAPARLRSDLGGAYDTMLVPPWGTDDARTLLTQLGAPQRLVGDPAMKVFLTVTRGHPALLRALAAFLRQRAWVMNHAALQALFSADYAKAERSEARRLLQETVLNPSERELLYRLDLVLGSIGDPQVDAVSAVEPSIPLPREKLADVKGLWIQDDGSTGFVLSPLLSGIGIEMLSSEAARGVRTALADEIVHRKIISPIDVDRVLSYFASADRWNRAAIYYVIALNAYLRTPKDFPLPGFIRRWLPSPPAQIDEPLTAFVLASQIAFLDHAKEDADAHIRSIVELLERQVQENGSEGDLLACISAALTAGPLRRATVGATTLRLARLAITFVRKLRDPAFADVEGVGRSVFPTIWISVGNVTTPADIREWSALIAFLTDEEVAKSQANAVIAQQGMRLMPKEAVRSEGRRTTSRWAALDDALSQLEATARAKHVAGLAVGVAAARILLKGGYQDDIDGAASVAENILAMPLSADDEFLIREELGHQFVRAKREQAAIAQFERALALDAKPYPGDLLRMHGAMSVVLRTSDPSRSLVHSKEAVTLAREKSVPRSELVRALAEHALTFSDPRDAFETWNEAVAIALSEPPHDDEERGLYAVLGRVSGYFRERTKTATTGNAFHLPIPGMFLQETAKASVFFKPALTCILMEEFASVLGHEHEATRWAQRAMQFVEEGVDEETRALAVRTCAPFWLRDDSFAVTIHGAAQSFSVLAAAEDPPLSGERFARAVALFPAILRAATLRIQRAPTAGAAALEIINACRAREAIAGDGHWEVAAQMVEASLVGDRAPLATLISRAKSMQDESLVWLAHLMGMFVANASLADALKGQVAALHASAVRGEELPALAKTITFPFLYAFWQRAFEQEPHRFSLRFKRALDEAATLGGGAGVRALFSSLLVEFPPAHVPVEFKTWLRVGSR